MTPKKRCENCLINSSLHRLLCLPAALALTGNISLAYEFEVRDTPLSMGGVISSAVQCHETSCFAALPFQPELSLRPGTGHEVFFKLGFAADNSGRVDSPFNIAPWAADLEANVENINGGSRSNLLNAWYGYTAELPSGGTFTTHAGIIDATQYLDQNSFSNDEYTQFMNSALVNGPNVFLPSYDTGLALAWSGSHWSTSGVYMHVGENDHDNAFNFVGLQLGYQTTTSLGDGNYRLVVDTTDRQFEDPTGTSLERCSGVLFSADQKIGDTVGLFTRLGWQDDGAAVDYSALYSGGIDLQGSAWNREHDNLGIGYAYLTGGNGDLRRSQVMEAYYRVAVNNYLSLTGDVQYMHDDRVSGENPRGFILGIRMAVEF